MCNHWVIYNCPAHSHSTIALTKKVSPLDKFSLAGTFYTSRDHGDLSELFLLQEHLNVVEAQFRSPVCSFQTKHLRVYSKTINIIRLLLLHNNCRRSFLGGLPSRWSRVMRYITCRLLFPKLLVGTRTLVSPGDLLEDRQQCRF